MCREILRDDFPALVISIFRDICIERFCVKKLSVTIATGPLSCVARSISADLLKGPQMLGSLLFRLFLT